MKKKRFFVFALFILAFSPVMAQKQPGYLVKSRYYAPKSWAWMKEAWNGNNAPYMKARKELDPIRNANKNRPVLLQKVRDQYNHNPKDSLALFRWAYVAYWSPSTLKESERYDILRAFDRAPSPHVYEYTRSRFLFQSKASLDPKLKEAGARLIEHDPTDRVNFLCQAIVLSCSDSLDDRKMAVEYAVALYNESPRNPTYASTAGSTYLDLWDKTKNVKDAETAIKYFQAYLKIASPTDNYISEAKRFIKIIQDELAKSGKTP